MKKSSWLSLATAAAIVATSAGTFAAWDVLESESDAVSITYAEGVKVTTKITNASLTDYTIGSTLNADLAVQIPFTVDVNNLPTSKDTQLTLSTADTNTNPEYTVKYYLATNVAPSTKGAEITDGVVAAPAENNYFIAEITANDTDTKPASNSSIKFKAVLSEKPAP